MSTFDTIGWIIAGILWVVFISVVLADWLADTRAGYWFESRWNNILTFTNNMIDRIKHR